MHRKGAICAAIAHTAEEDSLKAIVDRRQSSDARQAQMRMQPGSKGSKGGVGEAFREAGRKLHSGAQDFVNAMGAYRTKLISESKSAAGTSHDMTMASKCEWAMGNSLHAHRSW